MDPDPAAYGDAFAAVYDAWYGDVSDVDATVHALAALATAAADPDDGTRVLELGVGTGRIAIPLAREVDEVHGIDASTAMLGLLADKQGSEAVVTHLGDMADPGIDDPRGFHVVFVAFNTFFNLASDDRQRRCLAEVTELLHPDGVFVVEAFIPADSPDAPAWDAQHVSEPRPDGAGGTVVTRSRHDVVDQRVHGVHVHTRADDGTVERAWTIRYLHPWQLDAMAADAGLILVERWSDWRRSPFDPVGERHVSVYGRAPRRGEDRSHDSAIDHERAYG